MKNITILILTKLFLFTLLVNAKPLENPTIDLKLEVIEEKYQLTDKYDEPTPLPSEDGKKEDSQLNLDADVNKEKKQLDSLKIDIGKKF